MIKKFSICFSFKKNFSYKILRAIKKLNYINKSNFDTIPHINILSGVYKSEKELKKNFYKIIIANSIPIKLIGIGIFIREKNIIYLRFETTKLIRNLRKKIIKKIKINPKKIDYTASDAIWVPASTLCMTQFNNDRFLKSINLTKKIFKTETLMINNILLMDCTIVNKEKIITNIKINNN